MSAQRIWGQEPAPSGPRERWEKRVAMPEALLAVAFLVAYAWPILVPHAPTVVLAACHVVEAVTYVAFVIDYVIRFVLSHDRLGFLRHSTLDLLVLLLPMFRPLRTLRVVTLLQLLDRRIGRSLRGQIVVYLMVATGLVLFVAALAVLDAERGTRGSNIATFGDALWWAVTTITTVGYGEHHPVTTMGRVIAAGLMFSGIALLGVVTASVASWMVERLRDAEEENDELTRSDLDALTREVRGLRDEIAQLRAAQDGAVSREPRPGRGEDWPQPPL